MGRRPARPVRPQPTDPPGLLSDSGLIEQLVAELDGADTNLAEEAQAELESYGAAVFEPLMAAAPYFGRFGKLCATELFLAIGDARAGSVLIPMLRSEHDTVIEWAAEALGRLGVREAVPELRRAYDAERRRGTPLDWTGPTRLRDALTWLGAREEVVPERVAELAFADRTFQRCWAVEDLRAVIDALADAGQLVLYFMLWTRSEDTHAHLESPGWELDWSLPWSDLVEASRRDGLAAAREAGTPPETVAVVTWMDESDR